MPSRKSPETRPEPNLAAAAEEASVVIRGLQARLEQRPLEPQESPDELEHQLAQYFSRAPVAMPRKTALEEIRRRTIDGVADKILRGWEQGAPIESAIVERLIEILFDRFAEPIL